jgi:hypothetical protein
VDGMGLYEYCRGQPTNSFDSDGLCVRSCIICIGLIGGELGGFLYGCLWVIGVPVPEVMSKTLCFFSLLAIIGTFAAVYPDCATCIGCLAPPFDWDKHCNVPADVEKTLPKKGSPREYCRDQYERNTKRCSSCLSLCESRPGCNVKECVKQWMFECRNAALTQYDRCRTAWEFRNGYRGKY